MKFCLKHPQLCSSSRTGCLFWEQMKSYELDQWTSWASMLSPWFLHPLAPHPFSQELLKWSCSLARSGWSMNPWALDKPQVVDDPQPSSDSKNLMGQLGKCVFKGQPSLLSSSTLLCHVLSKTRAAGGQWQFEKREPVTSGCWPSPTTSTAWEGKPP